MLTGQTWLIYIFIIYIPRFTHQKASRWKYSRRIDALFVAISLFSLVNKTMSLARCSSWLTNSTFLRAQAHVSLERWLQIRLTVFRAYRFISRRVHRRTGKWKHQEKDQTRCCSVPRISCFERRDETNGWIDSSRAEQVSQRVPYNGWQKKKTTRNTSLIP